MTRAEHCKYWDMSLSGSAIIKKREFNLGSAYFNIYIEIV